MKTHHSLWLLLAIPFLQASHLPGTTFVNPPADDNPSNVFVGDTVHQLGTTYPVQWLTNLTSYSIWLYQQIGDVSSGAQAIFINDPEEPEQFKFSWNISVGTRLPLERSNVYFLALSNSTASSNLSRSERSKFFNLTAEPVLPVPSFSSGFSITSPSLSRSTSITYSTTTPSSTPTTTPSQPNSPTPSSPSPKSILHISLIVIASIFSTIILTLFISFQIYKARQLQSLIIEKTNDVLSKDLRDDGSRFSGQLGYKARLVRFWLVNNGVPVELSAERERGELE